MLGIGLAIVALILHLSGGPGEPPNASLVGDPIRVSPFDQVELNGAVQIWRLPPVMLWLLPLVAALALGLGAIRGMQRGSEGAGAYVKEVLLIGAVWCQILVLLPQFGVPTPSWTPWHLTALLSACCGYLLYVVGARLGDEWHGNQAELTTTDGAVDAA